MADELTRLCRSGLQISAIGSMIEDLIDDGTIDISQLTQAENRARTGLLRMMAHEYSIAEGLTEQFEFQPSEPDEDTIDRLDEIAEQLSSTRTRAKLWSTLAEQLTQHATRNQLNCVLPTKSGKGDDMLAIYASKDIRGFSTRKTPVKILDATGDEQLLQRWLPGCQVTAKIRARDTGATVIQITESGFGKTSLIDHPKAAPDEARRRANRRTEIAGLAHCLGRAHGSCALIMYKTLETALLEQLASSTGNPEALAIAQFLKDQGEAPFSDVDVMMSLMAREPVTRDQADEKGSGDLPASLWADEIYRCFAVEETSVELGHYNNLRGLDQWREVGTIRLALSAAGRHRPTAPTTSAFLPSRWRPLAAGCGVPAAPHGDGQSRHRRHTFRRPPLCRTAGHASAAASLGAASAA